MGEALAGRRRWILGAVAAVVLALIGYGVVHALTAGAAEKPAAVPTAKVDRGAVTTEVATTGTLQPAQTRSLSFAVAGTVESVSVRAGTAVTAGQVLAKVDDTTAAAAVSTAQTALTDAQNALTAARSAAAAPATTAAAACGSNVAVGYGWPTTTPTTSPAQTPTATASPTPTTTATAAPTRTTTTPAPTRGQTGAPAQTTAPGRSGGGSSACGTGGTGSGSGTGSGGQQSGGQQGGGSDPILSAEERVTQATTTLENAEDALDGATITAPIAGRILTVAGKVGSQVGAGSAFITLADVYDMQISADFPEADADRLAVRQKAVIGLADRADQEFKATVVQVDPTGTSDGTMVRYGVLLSFDEAPKDLLVGQSAAVRVTTGAKSGVLRVPSTAVHDVAGDSGTVLTGGAQVKVTIGLRGDQYTEVTAGLSDGDTVVRSW